MAHAILSRLVDPTLLQDREFHYQRAHLKERGSVGAYRLTREHQQKKAYHYFQDPTTYQWYFGNDNPQATKRLLGVMALGSLILYTATLALRIIQTVIILVGIFFRSYKATFSHRKEADFSERFFQAVEFQFFQQKEGLFFIGRSLVLDIQCSIAMGVSGVAANFYSDEHQIRKMQVIFSEMEQKWNKGPDFDVESGAEEISWHADNAAIANWALFLKNTSLKGMTYQDVLGRLEEVRKESNRTFYIYQCAQPLSQRFLARLDWIEGKFTTYDALIRHYEAQAQRLDQERY